MDSIPGYRLFPVEVVRKACNEYLDRRKKRIEQEREDLIEREMNKKKSLFSGPAKTREEAIKRLKTGEYMTPWDEVAWTGKMWKYKVEELSLLCDGKGGGSQVMVSSEMGFIFR